MYLRTKNRYLGIEADSTLEIADQTGIAGGSEHPAIVEGR